MDLNTLLTQYQTLLPWNLARLKCFVQIIFGIIIASNVQQHKCALGCARISLVFSAGEIPALERVKPAHQESSLGHMEETT
jgi:hypothetical protein